MQQQSQIINDLGFCPSFNCYYSDSQSSIAASKISNQLQQQQQQNTDRFHNVEDDEFQFSLIIGDEVISPENIVSDGHTGFPLFNRDLLIQNDSDRDTERGKLEEEVIACSNSLAKLFINEREETVSSSESDESDGEAPGVFCVWRHKNDVGASPFSKCKKSSSTGSGLKQWRIRDLLRRSNSEGKEPMVIQKQRVNIVAGKSKATSVHEVFYVQQRAKREVVKRKSYLPYRQGLVGFFGYGNGKGKKLSF